MFEVNNKKHSHSIIDVVLNVFVVNFEQISKLLTLNKLIPACI